MPTPPGTIPFPLGAREAWFSSVPPGKQNQADTPCNEHRSKDARARNLRRHKVSDKPRKQGNYKGGEESELQGLVIDLPLALVGEIQQSIKDPKLENAD